MKDSGFKGFDVHQPVRKYWRDLPHWRQEGATYFATFRLWDSLPQGALAHLITLRRSLESHAGEDALWIEADRQLFRELKRFLDAGHGACFMRDPRARQILQEALFHFHGTRYVLGESAVLPNHVHVIIRPLAPIALEEILHSWKSYTAKQINAIFKRTGRVWQEEAYDRIIRNELELARTESYIVANVK